MNLLFLRLSRLSLPAPALLAMVWFCTGCGGGNEPVSSFGMSAGAVGHGAELGLLEDADSRNAPVIFVDRQHSPGAYLYRIQSQEYHEKELLGLCRALSENDPEAAVILVPSAALTSDEIGLLKAKLREAGVRYIRVSDGRE